ncbi:MAG: T9SS type A sorting domain-containing protein [Calditrichota bacterium]
MTRRLPFFALLLVLCLVMTTFAVPNNIYSTVSELPMAVPTTAEGDVRLPGRHLDEVIFFEDWESGNLNGWTPFDLTAQPSTWHLDDFNAFGGTGTSWWLGDTSIVGTTPLNGYLDDWYMALNSPSINLPAGTPMLRFWHRYSCENPAGAEAPYNGWDGMNLRISTDNGSTWTIVPTTALTPAYDRTSLYSFGLQHGEGPNIPGWCGVSTGNTWHLQTANLSAWAGQSVKLRWAFASDPAYCTTDNRAMFGWQIDAIRVYAGTDTLFSDDANAVGEWTHTNVRPVGGNLWRIATDNTAPSGPHILVTNNVGNGLYNANMNSVIESPYIDASDLAYGQLIFDVQITGTVMCETGFPDCDYWGMEVSSDSSATWCAVSNPICDPEGTNYVYSDCPTTWSSFNDSYSIPMDFSALIGHALKFRFTFESNDDALLADGPKFDAFSAEYTAGFPNDLSCYTLQVRYPNMANRPFKIKAYFRNTGSNEQNSIQTWWRQVSSGNWRPFIGTFALTPGQTMTKDTMVVVTTAAADQVFQARIALGSDENTANDTSTVYGVTINPASANLELGYDNHQLSDTFYYYPRFATGEGAMVHFTPVADEIVSGNYNIQSILAQFSDSQPQDNMPIRLHIFAGGETAPGTEIYNELITVGWAEVGTFAWKTVNVSTDPDTRNLSEDFWVWFEVVSTDPTERYPAILGDDNLGWSDIHHYNYSGSGNPQAIDGYFQLHAIINEALDVVDPAQPMPTEWSLQQNYPNPFNPSTEIRYSVPRAEYMTLKVFNVMGQEVATLVDGMAQPGSHIATFDGANLASGVYVCRLESASFSATQKMLLMK